MPEPETTYEIHWLVPAENAIGGKAYWTAVSLPGGHMSTRIKEDAEHWFRNRNANISPRRLVVVERRVLETEP